MKAFGRRLFSATSSAASKTTRLAALGYEGERLTPNFFTMTKLVATVGPASDNPETINQFVKDGLRVMRMNFSHARYDEAKFRMDMLRSATGSHTYGSYIDSDGSVKNLVNTRASLLDTRGPEIRTGVIDGKIHLTTGDTIYLSTSEVYKEMTDGKVDGQQLIFADYPRLCATVVTGDTILLDDGGIALKVKSVDPQAEKVECEVLNSGQLGARKGVNLPGKSVDLPALTDKDKEDLRWGVENDVDFVAQSFVRKPSDVRECKDYIMEVIAELKAKSPEDISLSYPPRVIAKIESAEALENFDGILEESDGIMVARGDLGVEIPFEKVTQAQKIMVNKCNSVGKPVIVATQMLESMQNSPRPTRAEVSDVTNAIYDGADAVMLSGESANGKYPVESVQTMRRIIDEADDYMLSQLKEGSQVFDMENVSTENERDEAGMRQQAMCRAAVSAARSSNAKLIIVLVRGGTAARLLAKERPPQPIMALCLHPKAARQLNIHRGVYPVVGKGDLSDTGSQHRGHKHRHVDAREAIVTAKNIGWVASGDSVVVVNAHSGTDLYSSTLGVTLVQVK
eukprot:CAMPEP_0204843780 /NCGR_PEP_ID=MMETSP1346-20131115/48182_1 /ASSEMBLY_ACC=CAM_ASM_000771 /TAXON_ID=215587 /ORGANISM="Aplanochytrium stocchinoi, Strain GSBS06" /LENGTH=568 /DNA_ID=CAMNT_0051982987 /DNA_START=112 /DNA_END=1818 /DNA_ORIENTATION=+